MPQKKPHDPFAQREAQKYKNPIPSREAIISWMKSNDREFTHRQLAEVLAIRGTNPLEALRRRLLAMVRDGQLRRKRGRFRLVRDDYLVQGQLSLHRDGFGFVITDDEREDVFIPARQTRHLMDGDEVLVRVIEGDEQGRRSGVVVDILRRAMTHVVGRYALDADVAFLTPLGPQWQGKRFFVHPSTVAQDGDYVLAKVTRYPDDRQPLMTEVTEVLGQENLAGIAFELAKKAYDWPDQWSKAVRQELSALRPPEEEVGTRADWTQVPFVTIDGVTAKDFDDAVYVESLPSGGWRLCVAIADVSHYVQEGSALDKEAYRRATSVYFPGHVIPMLPPLLSDQWCSLQPNVLRLAMVVDCRLSPEGQLEDAVFERAVIRSHARFTYREVESMLTDPKRCPDFWKQPFQDAWALYEVLKRQHEARGALILDFSETQVQLNGRGFIRDIHPLERLESHQLIEQFMLMANHATARFLHKHRQRAMYRVHEVPAARKVLSLQKFLKSRGIAIELESPMTTQQLAQVADALRLEEGGDALQWLLLRVLPQAIYDAEMADHFGLSLEAYTHFTSPIRRYPDLLVHRAILRVLSGQKSSHQQKTWHQWARHCTLMEKRADQASRLALSWLKAVYMQERVGDTFDAQVIFVSESGMGVQLLPTGIEARLGVEALPDDYYRWDEAAQSLTGRCGDVRFDLGQSLKVRLDRVDIDACTLSCSFVEMTSCLGD